MPFKVGIGFSLSKARGQDGGLAPVPDFDHALSE